MRLSRNALRHTRFYCLIFTFHQSKGVQIAKAAKVVTVFSDSKDHGLGEGAQCGCVLVEDKIHVILGPENHDGPT